MSAALDPAVNHEAEDRAWESAVRRLYREREGRRRRITDEAGEKGTAPAESAEAAQENPKTREETLPRTNPLVNRPVPIEPIMGIIRQDGKPDRVVRLEPELAPESKPGRAP